VLKNSENTSKMLFNLLIGLGRPVVVQYVKLAHRFHPHPEKPENLLLGRQVGNLPRNRGQHKNMQITRESIFNDPEVRKRAHFLLRKINKAIRDYSLIEDGDKIAVAVSGGKDSLTLLHLLHWRRNFVPQKYELIAVNVQTDYGYGASRETLEAIFQREGLPYVFEHVSLKEGSRVDKEPLNCFWCSWNRRKALFLTAHRLGCNKLAFAHHADDAAATLLLNLFYHGRVEGMKPKLEFFGGVITVIRPLIYVEESEILRFARAAKLMLAVDDCPLKKATKRARMKELVKALERELPQIKVNLLKVALGTRYGRHRNM